MPVKPAIIANLRYEDAPGAIDFLCEAFGLERHAIFSDDENPHIVHNAQLVRDGHMIMLATATDSEWTKAASMTVPAVAGCNTIALYVVIEDVDAHCERARAAGAKIIREPQGEDYGGRNYGALDPEGYAWSFGSYDPWAWES
ncbi:MAG: VOC family protein [Parasphingopyxis sp.]|uniref:VOC family protein n=1 Tax=Parasphingopyxis sp. TaxID=1920299 RepID=UPI003F9F8C88